MGWTALGDAVCDSCPAERIGHPNRHEAIQRIRAGGWHHMAGTTIGGAPFESILCRSCVKDEHRRPRSTATIENEELPLDWAVERKVERGHSV